MPLTDADIRKAEPRDKPFKLFDAGGLFILIHPRGGKWWRLKYRLAGKEKQLSLGVYPNVSLEEARERRDSYRGMLAAGQDPGEHHREMKQADRDMRDRQGAAARFSLDSEGALSVKLGTRRVVLTPGETGDLRAFLHATREVPIRKEGVCR